MSIKQIDLPKDTISQLISIFSAYPQIERVQVFGSRALGNAKSGSDIDLAFTGKHLTSQVIGKIKFHLEEDTLLPYFFDCIHMELTQNKALLEHINTYGIDLYVSNPKH